MDVSVRPIVAVGQVWIPISMGGIHNTIQLRQLAGGEAAIISYGKVITYNHTLAPRKGYGLVVASLEIAQQALSILKTYTQRRKGQVMIVVYYMEPEVSIPSTHITNLNYLWGVIKWKYNHLQLFHTEVDGKVIKSGVSHLDYLPLNENAVVRLWAYHMPHFTLQITTYTHRVSVAIPCSMRLSTIAQLKKFLEHPGILLNRQRAEPIDTTQLTIPGVVYEYHLLLEDNSTVMGLIARLLGLYQETRYPQQTITLHLCTPIKGDDLCIRLNGCDTYAKLLEYLDNLDFPYRTWTRIYEDGKLVEGHGNIPENARVEVQRFRGKRDDGHS